MTAKIKLTGHLKDLTGGRAELNVESGQMVRAALTALGIAPESIALVVVNEVQQSKDYVIQEGDAIRILAVIGGG